MICISISLFKVNHYVSGNFVGLQWPMRMQAVIHICIQLSTSCKQKLGGLGTGPHYWGIKYGTTGPHYWGIKYMTPAGINTPS